jgi:hypothetical protein
LVPFALCMILRGVQRHLLLAHPFEVQLHGCAIWTHDSTTWEHHLRSAYWIYFRSPAYHKR